MKDNKFKTTLAFVSIFSFYNLCIGSNVGVFDVDAISGSVKDGVASVAQNFDVDNFFRTLSKVVKDVKHLDFDRSSELCVAIPATNQEVVYNWGFAGSGDLFTPLKSIKPILRTISSSKSFQGNFAIDLGKALLEDHMQQIGQNVPVLNKLLEIELTPKILFSLKTILLLKKFGSVGIEKIQADLLRLFIRLAQSEEFEALRGHTSLSSYLPEGVANIIEKASPSLMIFANEAFNIITDNDFSNKLISEGQKIVSVSGFVFNNKDVANRFFEKWQDYKDSNFAGKVGKAIKNAGYEQNSYEAFVEFKQSPDLIKNNLFAFKDFGVLQNDILPATLKSKATEVASFPKIIEVEDGDEFWILLVTDKFGASQTVKLMLSSLIQTFKDYKGARTNYFKANASQDAKLRKMLDDKQRKIAKIEKFLLSEYGQGSKKRVDDEIRRVNLSFANKIQFSGLQNEIEKIESEEKLLSQEIENRTDNLNENKNQMKKDLIAQEVKQIMALHEKRKKIEDKKKELNAKQQDVENESLDRVSQLEEVINDLDALEILESEKKAAGERVEEELENMISELKEKIEQLEGKDDSGLSLTERLTKRLTISQVYFYEAKRLDSELKSLLREIDSIADLSKKRVEKLKFSSVEEQFKLRIDSLNMQEQQILNENDKAEALAELREALTQVSEVSDAEKEKMQELEIEVGYIVDGKQCVGSVMSYLQNNKEINEFINLVNSEIPEYQGIKEALAGRLKFLSRNSDYIDHNKATLDLLTKKILPEFPISFNKD